jgi:hypothetical protein
VNLCLTCKKTQLRKKKERKTRRAAAKAQKKNLNAAAVLKI